MSYPLIETDSDPDFTTKAAGIMERAMTDAIEQRGFSIVGLSGGSTPREVYGALGQAKNIDWSKVWLFLVDDRYIREDSPHSNQFLVRSTLLRHAPVPESQLLFPDTELTIAQCVGLYEEHMHDLLQKGPPDIVTLGLGEDFHTASLFPPVSSDAFGQRLVLHTVTDRFDIRDRITTTVPVLAQARSQLVLLKGKAKKEAWEMMMEGDDDPKHYPLKAVMEEGRMTVVARW
jgi:6-phosphogluconolactonase